MTIVLTGGGSGGHIVPILTVASELKRLRPETRVVYIGQRGGNLNDLPAQHPAIDAVYSVYAGKFRRYKGEGWRQLLDVSTQAKNLRDAALVVIGLWQSFWLLRRLKPTIIFTRGGYVSVPVALAGRANGIPYITHDSDSTPSLANRLIARWALLHAVALPEETYPYPRAKTMMVGIPVSEQYRPVDQSLQEQYRHRLGLEAYREIIFITGGGNGADGLNRLTARMLVDILGRRPGLAVLHIAGRAHEAGLTRLYDELLPPAIRHRVVVCGFVTDMYRYSGAADLIIARGGATGIAEFAVQGKACIIIPATQLAWQTHHTQALAAHDALVVLDETEAGEQLPQIVSDLLDEPAKRQALSHNLQRLARTDAATRLAMILLEKR